MAEHTSTFAIDAYTKIAMLEEEKMRLKQQVKEYQDKIEQGTLIELPCKVGDSIWVIYQYGDCFGKVDEPFIEKDTAKFFVYDDNKMKIVPSNYGERSDYWYRVLDIFLTREEAEKRLKELQNEN